MGYTHTGRAINNGAVDPLVVTNAEELTVLPEDDGRQIDKYRKGDFEWWYFDVYDPVSGCNLKIILHIGTDPLRTKVIPQLAISVKTPENSESISYPFDISEMRADALQCNISVRNNIKIWAESGNNPGYFIKIKIPRFKCNFSFKNEIEGWKPFGKKVLYQSGRKKVDFSWVIPVPGAKVDGDLYYENKRYTFFGAIGYHDHNCIRPDRKHPLYLDDLVNKWFWGKCYAGKFTVIFGDVWCRTNRILPFMVAEGNKIIHSSNNLIECSVLSTGYDSVVRTEYPSSLSIMSQDESFPLQIEFESVRILDHKDLLEGVNKVLRLLIKSLIARPAYHGIFAKVKLNIGNNILEGHGNYESMVFRGK